MVNELPKYNHAAIRFMIVSAMGFAMMSVCVKAAANRGIPVLEIVAFRAAVSLVLSYLDVKRKRISIWGTKRWLLFARGAVGAAALICIYHTMSRLTLADATVLQYTYPAFTVVLALIFLGESINRATVLCIGLSLIGVIIMVQPGWIPSFADISPANLTLALSGAFGSAIAYVLVRRLSQTEDSSVIIFYFPLIALPISLIGLGGGFVVPNLSQLGILIMVGVFTQIGQIGLTKALSIERAGSVSAFGYIQVIFSAVLGILLFNEIPTLATVLGGVLIIGGAVVNALWKR